MDKSEQEKPDAVTLLDMIDYEGYHRPTEPLENILLMNVPGYCVTRSPEQLISLRDLLLRWSHNSFYIVSNCIGTKDPKKVGGKGLFMHTTRLRIAVRLMAETTPLDFDKNDKEPIKQRHGLRILLANCKQKSSLETFPLFCKSFNSLYLDIDDIVALEQRFPGIKWVDPRIQNEDPLYTTTENNISRVAPLVLYYWHCISGTIGESAHYTDLTQELPRSVMDELRDIPPRPVSWGLNDGIHFPSRQFREFVELPEESISPTLPFEMPKTFKRSRKNDIREYFTLREQLKSMGIYDVRNCAKIIYSLFPQLSHREIGQMFPATSKAKGGKDMDRNRGQWLLGLR